MKQDSFPTPGGSTQGAKTSIEGPCRVPKITPLPAPITVPLCRSGRLPAFLLAFWTVYSLCWWEHGMWHLGSAQDIFVN